MKFSQDRITDPDKKWEHRINCVEIQQVYHIPCDTKTWKHTILNRPSLLENVTNRELPNPGHKPKVLLHMSQRPFWKTIDFNGLPYTLLEKPMKTVYRFWGK